GLDAKGLREIPNVGRSIAEKVVAYLSTGHVPDIEARRAAVPAGVRALTAIPGLGPRKAHVLYEELGVSSVEQLEEAIREERLRDLKGFGEQSERNILHGISVLRNADGRILLGAATDVAEQIVAEMERIPG
ncbi:helix-hairpin-helix domain-containing protein, partial [Streptomyces sp. SID13726]|uniref:helix-hairpin-helix domain-containing protein n=2 Tax=Streptomyces TaxID=1883 RepID=UPI0013B5F0E4